MKQQALFTNLGFVCAATKYARYDQVLLDALAPLEEALARVEGALGGSVVGMQDVLDAAANPAFRRLLPAEQGDHTVGGCTGVESS